MRSLETSSSSAFFLTALLFAADRYLPASIDQAQSADLDKTIIRIRSARNLPEEIVLDTRSSRRHPRRKRPTHLLAKRSRR
jgi:hypothetical protein